MIHCYVSREDPRGVEGDEAPLTRRLLHEVRFDSKSVCLNTVVEGLYLVSSLEYGAKNRISRSAH